MYCTDGLGRPIYIRLHLEELAWTVGVPIGIIVVITILVAVLVHIFKRAEDAILKIFLAFLGLFGGFAVIAFIKWFLQSGEDLFNWIRYCVL